MSEESESAKTEQATEARIQKARESGDIPRSKELSTCTLLLAAGAGFTFFGNQMGSALQTLLKSGLRFDRDYAFDTELPLIKLGVQTSDLLFAFAPLALLLVVIALLSPIMIGGWSSSAEAILPNFNRLNPLKGLLNLVSKRSLVELIKAIIKTILVGTVGYLVIHNAFQNLLSFSHISLLSGISQTNAVLLKGFFLTSAALVFIAAIDVPYQLLTYNQKLRMTKQEVLQESKETNGNPEIKGRIRRQQREMARRRMMSAIPQADVVITNPTHYAVAIQYSQETMRAPKIIAKGADEVALKIREVALKHQVLILESPKLARALYAHTDLGDEIPQALYLAVAEILAYVFNINSFNPRNGAYPSQPTELDIPNALDPQFVSSAQSSAS